MDDTQDVGKVRIGGRVPTDLWDKVRQMGYTSQTDAIIAGLEKLVSGADVRWYAPEQPTTVSTEQSIADKIELAVLQARVQEQEDHIGTLKQDLYNAQETFRKHMELMKPIINENQRLLEPPESEKKKGFFKRIFG